MLNLRTRLAKLREHRAQEILRRRLELSLIASLVPEFARVAREAAAHPSKGALHGIIEGHKHRLRNILSRFYAQTFAAFGKRLIEASKGLFVDLVTKATPEELYNQRLRNFVYKWSLVKSADIADTTRLRLDSIIAGHATSKPDAEGNITANPGEDVVAVDIMEAMGDDASLARARTIARTESHAASQDAGHAAAEGIADATGLTLTKEWVSTNDDRTRESHRDANGQTVGMSEPFIVGDEKDELQYPGDPDGEAAEVINCRCVAVYAADTDALMQEIEASGDLTPEQADAAAGAM